MTVLDTWHLRNWYTNMDFAKIVYFLPESSSSPITMMQSYLHVEIAF